MAFLVLEVILAVNEPRVRMAGLQFAVLDPRKPESEVGFHANGQFVDIFHREPLGLPGVCFAVVSAPGVIQHRNPHLKEELVVSHGHSLAFVRLFTVDCQMKVEVFSQVVMSKIEQVPVAVPCMHFFVHSASKVFLVESLLAWGVLLCICDSQIDLILVSHHVVIATGCKLKA